MKTPNIQTQDWHLDNYVGKNVVVLDESARGIFLQRVVPNSKSREVWFIPHNYKNIVLPELVPPENKKAEDFK